jgi:hypothetical protein
MAWAQEEAVFWEKYQLVEAGTADARVLCMPLGSPASSR